jgi:mRNA interferase MazF
MKSTTLFDVVLVPFPFTDLSTAKRRPALVVAVLSPTRWRRRHLIISMMTSQVDGLAFPHDCGIVDLKSAGLPKPTLVRLAKMVTIDESILQKRLGLLGEPDRVRIRKEMRLLWKPLAQ